MNKITSAIEQFLSEHRHSSGDWPDVEREDMRQLCDIICSLISEKWDPDSDGDYPVEFTLVDRTRYEWLSTIPVPYMHLAQTEREKVHIIERHITNARSALDRLDTALRLRALDLENNNGRNP